MLPGFDRLLILAAFLFVTAQAHADPVHFRTPVKMLGTAYTIKISLRRAMVEYEVPVWIRPDLPRSLLDRAQLKDLGWIFKDVKPDGLRFSGEKIDFWNFADARTDWAYPPEYPKTCCYGVIGRDILEKYRLRFEPQKPAHIEWTRLEEGPSRGSSRFAMGLKSLFNLHEESVRYEGRS